MKLINQLLLSVLLAESILMFQTSSAQQTDKNYSVAIARSFIKRFPNPDSIHWAGQSNSFSCRAATLCLPWKKCGIQQTIQLTSIILKVC